MPLTEFDWFFGEHQNNQNNYVEQQFTMGEIGNNVAMLSLEIINATESNDGEYICRLENMHGYDEMVIKVEVLSPPQIENLSIENPFQLNNEEVAVEGSSSHIKCEVKGQVKNRSLFNCIYTYVLISTANTNCSVVERWHANNL